MYEMKIRVRYSETDRNGEVRPHQILEYFQDCGTFQSEALDMGVDADKRYARAWYVLAWDVKITRAPHRSEYITVTTQAYKMRGFYGYRRYAILDEAGEEIVTAESLWILMDIAKQLPMKVTREIAEAYVDEDADPTVRIKRKIALPEEEQEWEFCETIPITKMYLDSNNHVNNTIYAMWAEDVLPEGIKAREIRVDYRKAAVYKDTIKVFMREENTALSEVFMKERNTTTNSIFIQKENTATNSIFIQRGNTATNSTFIQRGNTPQSDVFTVKFVNQNGEIAALAEINVLPEFVD